MNITIAGFGYVGISNAILLGKKNNICIYDVNEAKVRSVNARSYTEYPDDIATALSKLKSISATTDPTIACKNADLVVIAVPTDWNNQKEIADMATVKSAVDTFIKINPNLQLIVRSTVSIGFIDTLETTFQPINSIIYIPEFLSEANLFYDTFHPSRFVIGINENVSSQKLKTIKHVFCSCCNIEDNKVFVMKYKEAEATKLLSNTYLAMRVAFFNDVDMLTSKLSMSSSAVIKGISSDPRIGNYYNVPSFGFGGYCLPKDVKNLTTLIADDNYPLFKSIIASNQARMSAVVDNIVTLSDSIREREQKQIITLGVYRLSMNGKNADFRNSPTIDVISHFKDLSEFRVLVFEPCLKTHSSHFFINCKSLNELKTNSDIILADRYSPELNDVYSKVYTNDISRYNEVSTQTNKKGWSQNQA